MRKQQLIILNEMKNMEKRETISRVLYEFEARMTTRATTRAAKSSRKLTTAASRQR
jgi:hypothetical protein